jgi:hypothetical protein
MATSIVKEFLELADIAMMTMHIELLSSGLRPLFEARIPQLGERTRKDVRLGFSIGSY